MPWRRKARPRTERKSVYWEKTMDLAPGSFSRSQMRCLARLSTLVVKAGPSRWMLRISLSFSALNSV